MKTPVRIFASGILTILLLLGGIGLHRSNAQPAGGISVNLFYQELAPYGEWLTMPGHGRVWRPAVSGDFRPYYTNGYWTLTEYGNTWVSDYEWGWAPFHYGRWLYDPYYGWVWVPDVHWGPAWVVWRNGGGYYGWAPMGPGISINISVGGGYNAPPDWWVFIPQRYIMHRNFHRHYHGPRQNVTIINKTTIINNIHVHNDNKYVYGPRKTEIERATGKPVREKTIQTQNGPRKTTVQGNRVAIYRPDVTQQTTTRPAPGNVREATPRTTNGNTRTNVGNSTQQRPTTTTPRANTTTQPTRNSTASPQRQVNQSPKATNPQTTPRTSQPATRSNTTTKPATTPRANSGTAAPTSRPAATPQSTNRPAQSTGKQGVTSRPAATRQVAQPTRSAPAVNQSRTSSPQINRSTPAARPANNATRQTNNAVSNNASTRNAR